MDSEFPVPGAVCIPRKTMAILVTILVAVSMTVAWVCLTFFRYTDTVVVHESAADETVMKLLSGGAVLRVTSEGGKGKTVKTITDLPSLNLKIVGMTIKKGSGTLITELPELPDLKTIIIDSFVSNDAAVVAAFEGLQEEMDSIQISHIAGLEDGTGLIDTIARRFKNLTSLNLNSVPLMGADIDDLSVLTKLTKLDLSKTGLNDEQISVFRDIPLKTLSVSSTLVTMKGLQNLQPTIKEMNLGALSLKDEDIALLVVRFPQLTVLNLSDSNITDASIPSLLKLTSLKTLQVKNSDVTSQGLEQLKKALPKAKVN